MTQMSQPWLQRLSEIDDRVKQLKKHVLVMRKISGKTVDNRTLLDQMYPEFKSKVDRMHKQQQEAASARNQSTPPSDDNNTGARTSILKDQTHEQQQEAAASARNQSTPPSDNSNKGAISLVVGALAAGAIAYWYTASNIKKLNKDIVDLKAKVDELHTTNKRSEKELKAKIKEIKELTEQLKQSDGKNEELKVKLFEAQQSLCQIIKNNTKFKKLEKTSAYRASIRMTDSMVTTVSENFKKLTSGLSSLFTRRSGGAAACGNTSRRSRNTGGTRKRRR
jgi:chromosome segregation ATPase